MWICTDNGLNRFDRESEKIIHYKHNPDNPGSLASNQVECIYQDRSGILWVGTEGGLSKFDPDTGKFVNYLLDPNNPGSVSQFQVQVIFEDETGRLWVGTKFRGIGLFDKKSEKFTFYQHNPDDPKSFSHNYVLQIYQDRSRNLWFGTKGGGLNKLKPKRKKFNHYKFRGENSWDSAQGNQVYAIFEDKFGVFWIGTEGGLHKFDRNAGQIAHYSIPINSNNLNINRIWAICEDNSGNLWLGTKGDGITIFNRKTEKVTRYKHDPKNPNSLSDDFAVALHQDQTGSIWIGTYEGLNEFDPERKQFKRYKHDPTIPYSLTHNRISAIYEDHSGKLWIGTYVGLNNIITENQETQKIAVKRYKSNPKDLNSLSNDRVWTICEDQSGKLWIGTNGGLNKYDRKTQQFTHYTEKDGLPNNNILGIVSDLEENLWLSTDHGISKFNPETESFVNYDIHDGLQANKFNRGACYKSKSGEMFFGCDNGINFFQTEQVKRNNHVPPIVLTGFKKFNKEVVLSKTISEIQKLELSYKDNFFSFEFAALDYVNPKKNHYAYMMEGFDEDWIYSGTKPYATYTNLNPGEYVFRVKGSNNDGLWNEAGTSIKIMISPPFWKTWWFRIFAGSVLLLTIFGWHNNRIRNIEMQKKQLSGEVKERTHELEISNRELVNSKTVAENANKSKSTFLANMSHEIRTPLNAIIGMTELSLETTLNSEQRGYLNIVQSSSESLLGLINDILDFSKIEAGQMEVENIDFNLHDVVEGTVEILSMRAETKGVELLCYLEPGISKWFVGDPTRLRQVLFNLTGNAIKFTESGEVTVTVEFANHLNKNGDNDKKIGLHFKVSDTGIGISQENLEKIFEKFSQADTSTTRKFGGTGLGLNISISLVELMGGEMWVDSQVGEGSTFQFELRLLKGNGNSADIDYADPDFNEKTVLVVDDNKTNRVILRKTLTAWGLRVKEAPSGPKALSILSKSKSPISIIILDQHMPEMDGFELAQSIMNNSKFKDIKMIMLSSVGTIKSDLKKQLGISKYIVKPVKQSKLFNILKVVLQNHEQTEKIAEELKPEKYHQKYRKSILLVEDNPDNQKLAKKILEKAGFLVEIARNGELAFEAFQKFRYDLILMDIQMPVMDGFEATKSIRAWARAQEEERVPIVALTAHAISGYREQCLKNDLDDYISKPIKKKILLSMVEKWIDPRPTILVADDSSDNRNLIKNYFKKETGCKLLFAHNGQEAVELVKSQNISLILMDMKMPVLNGYDATKAILNLQQGSEIPIIALTAHQGASEIKRCLNAGCTAYLSKPIRKHRLLELVDHHLQLSTCSITIVNSDLPVGLQN